MDKKNQPLVKKDFEKILVQALSDQAKSIVDAVDFGFENAKKDRLEIRSDISSLKQRIIFLENKFTDHTKKLDSQFEILDGNTKELKEIKDSLKNLIVVSKTDRMEAIQLVKRVEKLEMAVA